MARKIRGGFMALLWQRATSIIGMLISVKYHINQWFSGTGGVRSNGKMSGKARFVPVNRRNARKRAKKRGIVRFLPGKMRVRAVRLAAVRRDGGCARRRAQFVAKNAGKYEKTRKRAKKRGNARFCPKMPRSRRLPCGCAAGRRLRPPMRIICSEKRGKERKNAELRSFCPKIPHSRRPPCGCAAG